MNTDAESLNSAAVLELTKPSGDLGIVRPLITDAARGDLAAQRDIRGGYRNLSHDETRPLVLLAASAECAVMMGRLAASHGELDDVIALADALRRSAYLFELAGNVSISQARLIEALGLYKRIADAGHEGIDREYQQLAAAMPPAILERVNDDCQRLATQIDGATATESTRIH